MCSWLTWGGGKHDLWPSVSFHFVGPPEPSRSRDWSHRITQPCRLAPKVNRSLSSDWERILKVRLLLAMDRNMSLLRVNPEALTKKVCVVRDLEIKVRPSKVKKFYPNWVAPETMEAVIRARGEPRFFFYSLIVTKLANLWTCSFINLLTNNFISGWIVVPFSLQDWDYNMAACCSSVNWW